MFEIHTLNHYSFNEPTQHSKYLILLRIITKCFSLFYTLLQTSDHSLCHITIRNVQFSGSIWLGYPSNTAIIFRAESRLRYFPALTQNHPYKVIHITTDPRIIVRIYPASSDHYETIFIISSIAYIFLVCILI